MNNNPNFVHLHMHTDFSKLDGAASVRKYAERAKELGYPALACTEHGTMRGIFEQQKVCKEFNLKPIYGIEFYVANNMYRKGITEEEKRNLIAGLDKDDAKKILKTYAEKKGIKERTHLTVWAKNDVGLKNLYKLSSLSYTEGFYSSARIDFDTLFQHKDGLMVGSGCLASKISRLHQNGLYVEAQAISDRLYAEFGSDYYLEVQPHDLDDQRSYNKFLLQLHKQYGGKVKLVATQDSHYVNRDDNQSHDVLLCIGMHNKMNDPNRYRFSGDEYYFKTREEMWVSFKKHHDMSDELIEEALSSTMEIYEKANAEMHVEPELPYLPDVEIPGQFNTPYQYLQHLCLEGWKWRGISTKIAKEKQPVYVERLRHELMMIKSKGFEKYFLVVYDLYEWVRERGIFAGPGRGSSAGSLISYLLGITAVDPIEHGLLFERFISPSRVDLPDIDMDFEKARRHEIFDYLIEKYGRENVAQISTFGTLSGKACFKDVCRVFDVPFAKANKLSDLIPDKTENAIKAAYDEFDEFKKLGQKYPGLIENAIKLEGLNKNLGIHAAGCVASPVPLHEIIPVEIRKNDGEDVQVVAFEKKATEKMGLVKLDILGLKTLSTFKDTLIAIKKSTGKTIDLVTDVPLDDITTLAGFTERDFTGIFQFDSSTAFNICSGVNFETFHDIVLMTSLNRPGANTMAPECKLVKRGVKKANKNLFHPEVYKILEKTYGFIVYQEQAMAIAQHIAGYTPAGAEKFRKMISKSAGSDAMNMERDRFVAGCLAKTGMKNEKAQMLMDMLVKFGNYAFNLSHAVCYSVISYWCMWLKKHYPAEFARGMLKNEENSDKQQAQLSDTIAHKIQILPPDINDSGLSFELTNGVIRYGFLDVKGVGEKAAENLIANQPYSSLVDLLKKVNKSKCNKTVIEALLKAGAFDQLHPENADLVNNFSGFWSKLSGCDTEEEIQALAKRYLNGTLSQQERYLNIKTVMSYSFGLAGQVDKFIKESLKVKFEEVEKEFFDVDRDCFIFGELSGSKTYKVGDYEKKTLTEEQKKKMFWGSQYANCEFNFSGGIRNKVKFDIDIYEEMIDVIKADAGTSVAVFCSTNSERKTITARFAVNLDQLMRKMDDPDKFTYYDKILLGQHPMLHAEKGADEKMKLAINGKNFKKNSGGIFCGTVTNVRKRVDKWGREMAFVGLFGLNGFIEVTFFGRQWEDVAGDFKAKKNMCVRVKLNRNQRYGDSYVYDGQHKEIQ